MCTAVLSIKPGLPVLLAGVRDELTDRPWEPPGPHWPSYPGLLGGKGLQAGRTPLAVLRSGRPAGGVRNGFGLMAPGPPPRRLGAQPQWPPAGEAPAGVGAPRDGPFPPRV